MCDERERLIGYLYDECDAAERREIETHLKSCSVCRAEIGGLRNVRQDLLAWDVPDHSPVWRPIPAAAAPTVWWRQTPGWAFAAAAAVVLAAGVAGGAATRILAPAPVQAAVTPSELNEVQQQIVSMLRAELERVRTTTAAPDPAAVTVNAEALANDKQLERRLTTLLDASYSQTFQNFMGLNDLLQRYKGDSDRENQRLRRELEEMRQLIDQKGGGR
jgi:hypothetical protein